MKKIKSFWIRTKRILRENKNILTIIWEVSPAWVIYSCFVQLYEGIYPIFNNYTTKLMIDSVSQSLSSKSIENSVFITLFLIITGTVLLYIILAIKNYMDVVCIDKINMSINSKIMNKIASKPYFHFESPEKMDVIDRVRGQGSSKCIEQFNFSCSLIFYDIVFGIGTLFIMLRISWIISLLFVIVVSIRYMVNIKLSRYNYSNDVKLTNIKRKIQYIFNISVTMVFAKEIKIFNISNWINKKYLDLCKKYNIAHKKYIKKSLPIGLGSSIASTILYVVSYYIIIKKGILLDYSVGTVLFYTSSLSLFSSFLETIISHITTIYGNNLYTSDLFEVLSEDNDVVYEKSTILNTFDNLKINNVSFTYPGTKKQVLSNINLNIKSGESVCIVGRNGSGKSTLIKLILGLYKPEVGNISIDEENILDVKSKGIMFASATFQDYAKYSFTLKENIALDKEVEDNKLIDMLKSIDFSEDEIYGLPNNINTYLNREYDMDGVVLSEGQWQRVAVARAMGYDTPIVVLDEPTANLDPISEESIYNIINKNKSNKTVIMVSHRLSGVMSADKIVVVDNGKIVGIGKHSELMNTCGLYNKMFNIQAKRYISNS